MTSILQTFTSSCAAVGFCRMWLLSAGISAGNAARQWLLIAVRHVVFCGRHWWDCECDQCAWLNSLIQGFPNWGACTLICLSERVHLRLAREGKKYVYTLFISNYLYIWICPNHFMLLMGLDQGEYCVHTCLLYIWMIYLLNQATLKLGIILVKSYWSTWRLLMTFACFVQVYVGCKVY